MRRLALVVLGMALATPVAAQVRVRVSVSTSGVEGNGPSGAPAISGDGRFVAFASAASNLVAGDTNGVWDVFVRDRDTDADGVFDEQGGVSTTRLSVGAGGAQSNGTSLNPTITPDGRYVCFISTATGLVPGVPGGYYQVYRFDRTTGAIVLISSANDGTPADGESLAPSISDDGEWVAFQSSATNLRPFDGNTPSAAYVRFVPHGILLRVSPPAGAQPVSYVEPTISADGWRVLYRAVAAGPGDTISRLELYERAGSYSRRLDDRQWISARLSASGRHLVGQTFFAVGRHTVDLPADTTRLYPFVPAQAAGTSPSARYQLFANGSLFDLHLAAPRPLLGAPVSGAAFDRADRWLAVASEAALVPGDGNGAADVFAIDLPEAMDVDDDGLDDSWEAFFQATDPTADLDADGLTNADEHAAGSHPRGLHRRYLAEGSSGTFFSTAIELANPDRELPVTAVVSFDTRDGRRLHRTLSVGAARAESVPALEVGGLDAAEFSTVVESDRPLGVARGMTWDVLPTYVARRGYGSHLETATASPSPAWFLAEGSTVLGFDLFYLLQNPQASPVQATVRFLLPGGPPIARTYDLRPRSRTTVYVNGVPGLEETDVAGEITATAPIVVERAMYRSTPQQPLALGHASIGVPAAAPRWFLAEGATGGFFDTYVLVANPGPADAAIDVTFARPDGSRVTRQHTVRAHSRFSIYVDAVPGLSDTSVSTTVTSTNGVPIVVERSMYWPAGFFDYYESHGSPGSTATAHRWVLSGLHSDPLQSSAGYILIANTSDRAGTARLTYLMPLPMYTSAPIDIPLPPNSRTTLLALAGQPIPAAFGVLVESVGADPADLVVEGASYRTSTQGPFWNAGGGALAMPLP